MPELPEVETVRRIVGPQLAGRTVTGVDVRCEKIVAFPDATRFAETLRGRTFADAGRRGKFLIFTMDDGSRLFVHLRMTGELLVVPPDYAPEKHTHLILTLSDGNRLFYTDIRRFGRFWYVPADGDASVTGADRLGPEPTDPALTAKYLRSRCGESRRTIKEALLDQSLVAGIGNIYSDEILFAARVHPERVCDTLTPQEWRRVAGAIPQEIARAVELNETTPEDYLAGRGREYRNTPFLRVYGHAGEPCPVCGKTLEKCTVGGRTSVFCPKCQKTRKRKTPPVREIPEYSDDELPFP